ncbi:MAG: hypothetical protein N3A65_07740 [candidate division WOR-3 bacterium]|nr:hypothetical protein [candidate division WOR-3 bacterium]
MYHYYTGRHNDINYFFIDCSTDYTGQCRFRSSRHEKNYTKIILINAGVSLGLGIGAYYCSSTADNAYEEYKKASTMEETIEQWNKVVLCDKLKFVLGTGAVFFLGRSVYYQLKNVREQRLGGVMPVIDLKLARNGKLIVVVEKRL